MITLRKPATGPFSQVETVIITVPVLAASLLHSINMGTAFVALPHMQGNLSATPDQIGWVVTSFIVASAIGTALSGWLAVNLGRRRVFLGAIVAFTLTSLLCATASNLPELVMYRAIQGFASAPILPLSQAIMLDTYPPRKHGMAMSIWSMGMILGPVLGPTLGALMTELYGWRSVFLLNVPLGFVGFLGILFTLPETDRRNQRMDWLGLTALCIGVAVLQLMLDRGERLDWFESTEVIVEATIAALGFYIFIAHSMTARQPYINLAIFTDRNYVVGLALIFVFGVTVFASMFLLPMFLQNIQGYPVLTAGWVMSARGIGTGVAMVIAGYVADRVPAKYPIWAGFAFVGFSNWWMTGWNHEVSAWEIVWVTIVNGMGMGMMWVALTAVTFSTLSPQFRTEGAALFALIRAIGASMGTSIVVAMLTRNAQISYVELRDHVNPFNAAVKALADTPWDIETITGLARLRREVITQAETIAFLNDFVLLLITIVVAMPLVLLLKPKPAPQAAAKPAPKPEPEPTAAEAAAAPARAAAE